MVRNLISAGLCCWLPWVSAAPTLPLNRQGQVGVSAGNVGQWALSLVVVLVIFFLCIWLMRRLTAGGFAGAGKMRVLGALSLGVREKVILLDVGNKQLLLGVAPGRIETLHVLEGEDRLFDDCASATDGAQSFAEKLKQAMHR